MAGELENVEDRPAAVLERVPLLAVIAGVLLAYWVSVLFGSSSPLLWAARVATGSVLVLFLPGALLTALLGLEAESAGRFLVYAVGTSVALLAVVTTLASLSLPALGIAAPIAVLPLVLVCSVVVLGLATAVRFRDVTFPSLPTELVGPTPVVAFLLLLPVVSIFAAETMNRWRSNVGMYLFLGLVLLLVLLSASRALPPQLYPVAILSTSLSVLLHRNLLTDHVVGADIQSFYAVSAHVVEVGSWAPATAGTASALPVVTSVPAALSLLTGLTVATTYKTLFVFVFALTPLGLYYVVRDAFDEDVALYGALIFSFYHVSFFFTPGKQLVSELFVVLLLMTLWSDAPGWGRVTSLGLLSAALVMTHYGMTYVFGAALLVASFVLWSDTLLVGRRLFDRFGRTIPIGYPAFLLVAATAWYGYASNELLDRLASIPRSLFDQVATLLARGTVEGSGASYVGGQTTFLETLQLYLYLLLTILVAVGLAWRTASHLLRIHRGDDPGRVDYTAIAIPLFAFLGASYVLVFNLWADRVYQLVLVVLAPFAAYGYRQIGAGVMAAIRRSREAAPIRPNWGLLAILLALLLAFNSGMAFAVAGEATTSTFNADANDLAFRDGELAAADWLERQPAIERTDEPRLRGGSGPSDDGSERVIIYTDPVSAQLFRAVLNERFYNVDVVVLKKRWRPTFDPETIGEGYVFVRERGITTEPAEGTLPPSFFSHEEVDTIEARGDVVYRNEDVVVYRTEANDS